MSNVEDRRKTLEAMRGLLWFLETNPDVPLPNFNFTEYVWHRKDMAAKARLLGSVKKVAGDGTLSLVRDFGDKNVSLSVKAYQSSVCERKVVGSKKVEFQPARPAVAEHMEDVYEYDCSTPLLERDDG